MEYHRSMAGRGKGGKGKLMENVFVPVDIQEIFANIVNVALKFHTKIIVIYNFR